MVKHDDVDEIVHPGDTSLHQYVSDNTDHDMATLDGKNTHHGLGSIAIANGNFSNALDVRKKIPRDKKQPWSTVTPNKGIPIVQYYGPDTPALTKKNLIAIKPVKIFIFCLK